MDGRSFRPSVHPSLTGFRRNGERLRRDLAVGPDRPLILPFDCDAHGARVAGPHHEPRDGIQRDVRVRRELPLDHFLTIHHHADPYLPQGRDFGALRRYVDWRWRRLCGRLRRRRRRFGGHLICWRGLVAVSTECEEREDGNHQNRRSRGGRGRDAFAAGASHPERCRHGAALDSERVACRGRFHPRFFRKRVDARRGRSIPAVEIEPIGRI